MKAFITNFNANRIISNLNHQVWYGGNTIFEQQFKWLNIREISELYAYFSLCFAPDSILERYRQIHISKDVYVYESSSSYHKYSDCDLMNSSFNNFKIPEVIKNQGVEKIQEYRNYFIENKELITNQFDFFKDKIRWKFGDKCIPEKIDFENSGHVEKENYSLKEIKDNVKLVLAKTREFVNSSSKNQIIINRLWG